MVHQMNQDYVDGSPDPRTGIETSASGSALLASQGEAIPPLHEEDPFGHLSLDSLGASQPRAEASQPRACQPSAPFSMASQASELLQAARSIKEEQS